MQISKKTCIKQGHPLIRKTILIRMKNGITVGTADIRLQKDNANFLLKIIKTTALRAYQQCSDTGGSWNFLLI
jgi:hypothetical protein